MNKAAGAGRTDGLFIEPLGIELAAFDPRDFGANQRCTILEVLRTMCSPGPKLSLVPPKCFSMLCVRIGVHGLAACGARQCGIEVIFLLLQQNERQRRVPCLRLVRRFDRRHVIPSEEARLELSYPV